MKIITGIAFCGIFCSAPFFSLGDENTNAPVTIVAAPTSVPATNHSAQVAPADDSIDSLHKKAEAGDAKSQYELGKLYLLGQGVARDPVEAFKWFSKAGDQGYPSAQYYLGVCYETGMGVVIDAAQSLAWYRKAADQGNAAAQFSLGFDYLIGTGVGKDTTVAVSWFSKAAAQGDVYAELYLATCYANGAGVEKDAVEAAKWFRKSAEQGNAQAQYYLGVAYARGDGVQKDVTESAKWYRKAADQGFAKAQLQLSAYYYTGIGVQKDIVQSAKWARMAAEQGNAQAQYGLGLFYRDGTGVKKDEVEAVKWFRLAAEQGNALAQYNLGMAYEKGAGVEKDVAEAVKWYRKAAEQGNAWAQGSIGLFYIQGLGVVKNEVEGLAWLYVSSASGNQSSANVISTYENIYNGTIIEAARQRATDLQAQIASHTTSANNDSTAAIAQPVPAPNIPRASGSGAFISADGLVLTAAHVVQGAKRIEVVTGAGTLAAIVEKIDASNDVALLKCTGSNFIPLPIAPSKEARAGTSVFTVGFPNIQLQGFDPKLTKGEISSQTGFQDDPRDWQISVPIQPGNSGGPLCDENGNLIGIIESTLNPMTMAKIAGEIPQNVNYAVKSSYILPLLDDVQNLPKPRGSSTGKFEDVVDSVRPSTVLILVY